MIPERRSTYGAVIAERRERLGEELLKVIPPASTFVWEVGSGHGHFLAAYAAAHPESLCVGVDIASDRVARAKRKGERARLKNVHFFLADAEDFLAVVPKKARIGAIFILFPDPWPKRRHHKNRVMKTSFLDSVAALSRKGAGLYFRTDHEAYFREAAGIIRGHPDWTESDPGLWPFEEPTVFQKRADSHFTLVARRR